MRTNIEIDEHLMKRAMKALGQSTKKATVAEALQLAVERAERLDALHQLRGLGWEGDLDEMRTDWSPETDWGLQGKP